MNQLQDSGEKSWRFVSGHLANTYVSTGACWEDYLKGYPDLHGAKHIERRLDFRHHPHDMRRFFDENGLIQKPIEGDYKEFNF